MPTYERARARHASRPVRDIEPRRSGSGSRQHSARHNADLSTIAERRREDEATRACLMLCGPRIGSNDFTKNEIFQLRLRAPHGNDSGRNCATGRSASRSLPPRDARNPDRPLRESLGRRSRGTRRFQRMDGGPAVLIFRGNCAVRDISGCCFVRRAVSPSLSFPSFFLSSFSLLQKSYRNSFPRLASSRRIPRAAAIATRINPPRLIPLEI